MYVCVCVRLCYVTQWKNGLNPLNCYQMISHNGSMFESRIDIYLYTHQTIVQLPLAAVKLVFYMKYITCSIKKTYHFLWYVAATDAVVILRLFYESHGCK